jgi:4-hydroxy-3-methylbut-2-en-1-yl diphosphate reductase
MLTRLRTIQQEGVLSRSTEGWAMKIIKANVLGMCFGVRDALTIIADVEVPQEVTIHGELVHNEKVLDNLAGRGFRMLHEFQRHALPVVTDTVLVTAHGISERERQRLLAAGKVLIDTTCPLVTRAHQAAQRLQADGFHVLIVGRRGHVEVQGIIEDLRSFDVIESAAEVSTYEGPKIGIMCQTTTPAHLVDEVRAAVAARNPRADIRFVDTVCHPTKDHQTALERLMREVDAMVVVGGKNSNNTRQLALRCQAIGLRAFHVQGPEDLHGEWFDGVATVGLTAGTSTLDETIGAVETELRRIAAREPAPTAEKGPDQHASVEERSLFRTLS